MQLSKILIFGGKFNPIHYGHLHILKKAIETVNPDNTFIVPSFIDFNSDLNALIDDKDRINMLEIALKHFSNISVELFEINNKRITYTIETIYYFLNKYPNTKLYFLLGADQWNNLNNWKEFDKLCQLVTFVVAQRDNQILNIYNNVNPVIINNNVCNVSSSQIRKMPKLYDTTVEVNEYINNHGLYAIGRIKPLMSEHRFNHSLRVAYYAMKLIATIKPEMKYLAYSAGIYHDIAKEMPLDQQEEIAKNILGIHNYAHPKLLHGYIGSYLLKRDFCFENNEILHAICRHTRPFDYFSNEPDLLTKVLYLADKLEPNRNDDDVFGENINNFRILAEQNIDECFIKLYDLLQFNLSKKTK